MLRYETHLKTTSRSLRKNMTEAERKLWSCLRRKQLAGIQFYRQKPIGGFVVDFYAPQAGLVIEVDLGQHWEEEHRGRDEERDRELETKGLRVLRFSNREVLREREAVLEVIAGEVAERKISPNPSFSKRGTPGPPGEEE